MVSRVVMGGKYESKKVKKKCRRLVGRIVRARMRFRARARFANVPGNAYRMSVECTR